MLFAPLYTHEKFLLQLNSALATRPFDNKCFIKTTLILKWIVQTHFGWHILLEYNLRMISKLYVFEYEVIMKSLKNSSVSFQACHEDIVYSGKYCFLKQGVANWNQLAITHNKPFSFNSNGTLKCQV
jgi:hypothetical protein